MKKVNGREIHNLGRIFINGVFVTAVSVLIMVLPVYANNTQVSTPTLTGQNTTHHYTYVQFDLSWENSWRSDIAGAGQAVPYNYDAAWVFVKYKPTGGDWAHATLHTSGHSVTNDNEVAATIMTPADGKGVFLYRTNNGTSSIDWDGVKLRWNYGADGLGDDTTHTVKVFAIEMVYIPQDAFYVGDANANLWYCFYKYGTAEPYRVTSEGEINIGATNNYLWAAAYAEESTLPATFPKGYAAIYCMKYEFSQGQYADFLNTLTSTQDENRFPNSDGQSRHTIGGSAGSHSASVPSRACNFLSWMDGCAYADWAGLRPMTELEFEKICRGTLIPVNDEYAWGNANIADDAYILSHDGEPDATVSNAASEPYGNASYDTTNGDIDGPLRCGIFAASTTHFNNRVEAGASYYGVMEMSGNVWERTVTVANATGRLFTGTHGDGVLTTNGNATNSDWPGFSGGEVTGATGSGYRGGSWYNQIVSYLCVSARNHGGYTHDGARLYNDGFRCVRSAP